jgi:hypothetical protein
VRLVDAAPGATPAQLAPPMKDVWVIAGFLPRGRVAVATGEAGRLTLRLFDRAGGAQRELALGAGRWARLGALWGADLLPFAAQARATREDVPMKGWRDELRTVDLVSGQVRVLGERLTPVTGASLWWTGDDRLAPGAPASRLFRSYDGALVRIDDAGTRTRVLPFAGDRRRAPSRPAR